MNEKRHIRRRLAASALSVISAVGLLVPTTLAYADLDATRASQRSVKAQITEKQNELEVASESFNAANIRHDEAKAALDGINADIAWHEEEIARLQKNVDKRNVELYKSDPLSTLNMLLSVDSLGELLESIGTIFKMNADDANAAADLKAEKEELAANIEEAAKTEAEAQAALDEAAALKDQLDSGVADLEKRLRTLNAEEQRLLAGQYTPNASSSVPSSAIPDHGEVIDYARSRLGCPYRYGASGPNSFDCSGFTQWCYSQAGVASLPHQSESQKSCARYVTGTDQARVGDVVWRSGHVGLVSGIDDPDGDGVGSVCRVIHAPHTGDVVREVSVSPSSYRCVLHF